MPRGRVFTAEEIARANAHPSRRELGRRPEQLANLAKAREVLARRRVGAMSSADLAVRQERADFEYIRDLGILNSRTASVVG